ncbi:MAG: AsmA family protein [Candidatus Omnitrophota bacterium]|nr:AsmA family protein [Candidatus Omnitrophota bacterium]
MKKIILSVITLLMLLAIAGAVYLNEVILPRKIRSTLVKGFESATGKRVELSSAKLDLFKGLVLKDLAILDNDLWVVTANEADLKFLIIPLFKKQIIITSLKLESPKIFVERTKDNSINIIETFFKKPILLNGEYSFAILRIMLSKASISFKDSMFEPPLLKDIKNASLDAHLSLPDKIAFDSEFELTSPELPMFIKASGKYEALKKEWSFDIKARDFRLKELFPYCKDWNFILPDGRADTEAVVRINSDRLGAKISMTSLGLEFSQSGPIKADINCALTVNAEYDFNKKELLYSGDIDIKNLKLSGLEYVDKIDDIRGKAVFTESKFLSKKLTCTLVGLPVTAIANLTDFKTGSLNIDIKSSAELGMLKDVLKNRFKIDIPAQPSGPGDLSLRLKYKVPIREMPVVSGYVDIPGAKITLDYNKTPLDNVKGRFRFTSNQLSWEDITFKHMDAGYSSSGTLTNFEKPGIEIKLESTRLSVRSLLAFNDNLLTLSRLEGRYEGAEFSIYGDLDTANPANITADLSGIIKFGLNENKELLKRFESIMKDSKPLGRLTAKFALKGNINDLISCDADVEVSGPSISLYGFKMEDFTMSCMQRNGIMDIVEVQASLYGGTLEGAGRFDLASKDGTYQIKAEIKNLKIEKIKLDTAFRDYDILGSIYSRFGFKGYSSDPSKFSAWGKINISNGKLWQLNLFRGIGTLVFNRDFSSVIFKEGDCDFYVKDRTISTNDISLRSDLLNITGVARIGFDNSIAASLKAEFTDEGVDASNMAGAIERYSIMEVSGTLKEPKFKVRPDLSNVARDIAESLFQQ